MQVFINSRSNLVPIIIVFLILYKLEERDVSENRVQKAALAESCFASMPIVYSLSYS